LVAVASGVGARVASVADAAGAEVVSGSPPVPGEVASPMGASGFSRAAIRARTSSAESALTATDFASSASNSSCLDCAGSPLPNHIIAPATALWARKEISSPALSDALRWTGLKALWWRITFPQRPTRCFHVLGHAGTPSP